MPDLENNMDELFRKAAGGYPLKTSEDGWEDIAPLLQNTASASATSKKKNIKKYSALLLSLLLFLFTAGIVAKHSWNKKAAVLAGHTDLKTSKFKTDHSITKQASVVTDKKLTDKNPVLINKSDDTNLKNLGTKKTTTVYEKSSIQNSIYNGASNAKNAEKKLQLLDMPALNGELMQEKISPENIVIGKHETVDNVDNEPVLQQSNLKSSLPGEKDSMIPGEKAISNKRENITKQPGLYLGIFFGPSFNQVKTQGLKKPGYDVGIIAGYQINKALSLETGLMFDRKYYFSNGKYFDMSKVSSSMPADMKVLSMEGTCAIFEIPVKIKYNLQGKGNSNFYSTAGISTYIISKEYNKYRAVTNGTEQNIIGSYNNASRYLAAALDLSLGYQSKIGAHGSMRLEPYVQIPLKGIGVGSLPVMTVGLNIGFTRLIH